MTPEMQQKLRTDRSLHIYAEDWDSTSYDMSSVMTWMAFTTLKGSAWDNSSLWVSMLLNFSLSVAVALCTLWMPGVQSVTTSELTRLGTFLNVFVGMLLGFFLSSSMNRWFACVNSFLQLLDAVRSLQMQCCALGVSEESTAMLSRYGVLSAWLLHFSLRLDSTIPDTDDNITKRATFLWDCVHDLRPHLVRPEEQAILERHKQAYALLWTWVASLVGRMAQDGEIPPMASPTYGRILNIVQTAYGNMREVRKLHQVKVPFVYLHTLAVLVHVNNIINAISFGLVTGTILNIHSVSDAKHAANTLTTSLMSFFMCMVAPLLYLALLEVGVCIAQPFSFDDAKIPAAQFIRSLEDDLKSASVIAEHPPGWKKPRFRDSGKLGPLTPREGQRE